MKWLLYVLNIVINLQSVKVVSLYGFMLKCCSMIPVIPWNNLFLAILVIGLENLVFKIENLVFKIDQLQSQLGELFFPTTKICVLSKPEKL